MSLLRSTLVSSTCTSTVGVGTGVPFGYIVTADGGITTGVSSSSESYSPASSRLPFGSTFSTFGVAHPPCREQAPYPLYALLSLLCPCLGLVVLFVVVSSCFVLFCFAPMSSCLYGNRSCLPHYLQFTRHLSGELLSLPFGQRVCQGGSVPAGNHGRYFVVLPFGERSKSRPHCL